MWRARRYLELRKSKPSEFLKLTSVTQWKFVALKKQAGPAYAAYTGNVF